MILDCKAQNCEPCAANDCTDQWEVLSTSVLTIERKFPGFTLIPDEMASNCPICKTQQGEPCIIPWKYDSNGKCPGIYNLRYSALCINSSCSEDVSSNLP